MAVPGGVVDRARVAKDVPRDSEVLENLARYQAAMGRNFEAHLNYAKAFAYKRQFSKYAFHMEKSEALATNAQERDRIVQVRAEISELSPAPPPATDRSEEQRPG